MSDHYYTNTPSAKHQLDKWQYQLRNKTFTFYTDSGVFSKKTVDFGSRLLIEILDFEGLVSGNILDVGCGYGPMGLAVAKENPERTVEMVDVNLRAIELATKNAIENQLFNTNIHESSVYEQVAGESFALIISNPPIRAGKKVVHAILEGAYQLLAVGGKLVIVIQKKQGAPSAQQKMADTFGNAEIIKKDKGYFIIESVKES
ncbi:class I SAM-dependent methyltransferase [Isobaculum melis]|uniref:16S rRNA m(2)G 1207 methyltransferase n=1 Tax=Isobaculum melis TaxID=142588 RepID=A0A1H9SI09_9LACT|nr:class I SAM-dependent methyltransferase [Isobaculum melis]SER83859.1 16S rRNA m(2)G 1207 methyltransferase [Isobaculum melis]